MVRVPSRKGRPGRNPGLGCARGGRGECLGYGSAVPCSPASLIPPGNARGPAEEERVPTSVLYAPRMPTLGSGHSPPHPDPDSPGPH